MANKELRKRATGSADIRLMHLLFRIMPYRMLVDHCTANPQFPQGRGHVEPRFASGMGIQHLQWKSHEHMEIEQFQSTKSRIPSRETRIWQTNCIIETSRFNQLVLDDSALGYQHETTGDIERGKLDLTSATEPATLYDWNRNMNSPDVLQQSVRAGVFSDIESADRAVIKLLANEFQTDQITVVCAGEQNEHHYRHFEKPNHTLPIDGEVATGATLGAAAGGIAAIAIGLASGAVPLIIAGAAGIAGGSTMGGFMGAMMSRGVETEFSQFFHDQLEAGHIVVVVSDHGPNCETRLAEASEIFHEAGCLVVSGVHDYA